MNKINNLINTKFEAKPFQSRLIKATFLIMLLVAVLVWRLFYLQIHENQHYTILSKHNQIEHLPVEPNRGLIYDRNGILLAENLPVFSLDLVPDRIANIAATIKRLQRIIKISEDDIAHFHKNLKRHHRYEPTSLKVKLTQEEVTNLYVNQYHFPGVMVNAHLVRHYPQNNVMASVLGYVGRINPNDLSKIDINNYRASNFIGKTGIEKYYEQQLHGKTGFKEVEVNASGKVVRTLKLDPPVAGDTLHLTVDSKMQKIAEEAMGDERGAVVAIDPNNGEILTMVSTPSFDPNLFTNGIDNNTFQQLQLADDKPLFNRAIRAIFPFASTIKPYLALAGFEHEIINANTSIFDPGWFKLPNSSHRYRDWVYQGHGEVNVTKAIIESCDIFFYNLAVKLGIERIDAILEKFGFGAKTGVDTADERAGIVASPAWKMKHYGKPWYPGDTVNSGIGQGYMSATPIQLAAGVATLANRGQRFQPHLLLKSVAENNSVHLTPIKSLPPVIFKNPQIWDMVIDAMERVVSDPRGTARTRFGTKVPYTVAGKTGGAQLFHHKLVNENPTPLSEESITKRLRNHTLFIAFAPIAKPKIALAVIVENGSTAPVVARKLMDYYLAANNGTSDEEEDAN